MERQDRHPSPWKQPEQRLMGRLDTVPVDQISAGSRRLPWQISAGALAACVAVAAGLAGVHLYHSKAQPVAQPSTAARVEAQKPVAAPSDQTNLRSELEHNQRRIAELQQQVNEDKDNFQQSNATVTRMQQQIEAETDERNQTSDERDQLRQQLAAAQTEAQSLRDKTAATGTVAAQQAAITTSLEARLRDANAALEEKDRMLALDKEFLAHDREIRDLIGARDLYIADIYDVAQNGKTNKPFGRVF
jgi:DNA repair exonuclease SbcCD ATPase subunit